MNARSRGSFLGLCLALGAAQALAQAPSGSTPAARSTRHALVIGIGEYGDPNVPALKGVVHDMQSARRMAQAMAIAPAQITMLRDTEATAERIRAEIRALDSRVKPGDRVFVYYSGHGTRWFDETVRKEGCTEGLLASDGKVLTNVELAQALAPLARRADKMLVFYDACYSGGFAETPFRTRSLQRGAESITPKFTRAGAPDACGNPSNFRTRSLNDAMRQSAVLAGNVVHVAASRPDEVSFDSSISGGFATSAWRDCLLGEARDLDASGAVTADEVTACAQAKVDRALAGQAGITGQNLTVAGNGAFVPAWIGAAFTGAISAQALAAPTAAAPALATQSPQALPTPTQVFPAQAMPSTAGTVPAMPAQAVQALPSPALAAAPATPALASPAPALPAAAAPAPAPAPALLAPPPRPAPAAAMAPAPSAAAPAVATPAQLLAEVYAQRDAARRLTLQLKRTRLRIGIDPLELVVTSPRDGWLYLALAGSDGKSLYLLFPNDLAGDNRVRAGQPLSLPGPAWEMLASGPAGFETLLALVSDAPREITQLPAEKAGPFMRTLLDAQGRARLQALLANGTPAADCGRAGATSCSDAFGAALVRVEALR